MGAFADEVREAVAAANDRVGIEIEKSITAGRAVHFMKDGRYYERTRDGVFEIVEDGDGWVRVAEVARRVDERTPAPALAIGL
jgi:hypothetical protein